eukprot:Hpha_TRINITY_DN3398_c0_g1::TRINITY_DN3398_c0_g1_i2::g.172438::m.172438
MPKAAGRLVRLLDGSSLALEWDAGTRELRVSPWGLVIVSVSLYAAEGPTGLALRLQQGGVRVVGTMREEAMGALQFARRCGVVTEDCTAPVVRVPEDAPSVQAAVDSLPCTGGSVELAPGVYRETVSIDRAVLIRPREGLTPLDVTIEGTGTPCVEVLPGGEGSAIHGVQLRQGGATGRGGGSGEVSACVVRGGAVRLFEVS